MVASGPMTKLRFDIYEGSFLQRGASVKGRLKKNDRPPVLRNASGGEVVFHWRFLSL